MTLRLTSLVEPLAKPDHGRGVPLPARSAYYLAGVQLDRRPGRRHAGQLGHDRPHALGEGVGVLLAALTARRSAAEFFAALLGNREALLRPLADELPLLLRQSGEQVQDERVNVGAKLSDDERHPVRHQPRDKMHPFRGLELPGGLDGGRELRSAVERVRALARLDLLEGPGDRVTLGLGKTGNGLALGLQAEAAAALALRRNPDVGDRLHSLPLGSKHLNERRGVIYSP